MEGLLEYGAVGILAFMLSIAVVYLYTDVKNAKVAGDHRYNDLVEKYDVLQQKYEQVLIDVGQLKGKLDTEIEINEKLESIFNILKKSKK